MEKLALYGYSGFDNQNMELFKKTLLPSDGLHVILMQEAVVGSLKTGFSSYYDDLISQGTKIYCVKEDLHARGFSDSDLKEEIEIVDYGQVIDHIEQSKKLISWL